MTAPVSEESSLKFLNAALSISVSVLNMKEVSWISAANDEGLSRNMNLFWLGLISWCLYCFRFRNHLQDYVILFISNLFIQVTWFVYYYDPVIFL